MVIHDEDSLEQALQLVALGPVRYFDTYGSLVISNPDTLVKQVRSALNRNEIALVVPRGMDNTMENFDRELARVRKLRKQQERHQVREWIRTHPLEAKKIREAVNKALESE